jgi:hypothetical protein
MIIQSIIIGTIFGILWGSIFHQRYKSITESGTLSKTSIRFLASASTIRYLLLAALLAILVINKKIILIWWLAGFIVSFWIFLFKTTKP